MCGQSEPHPTGLSWGSEALMGHKGFPRGPTLPGAQPIEDVGITKTEASAATFHRRDSGHDQRFQVLRSRPVPLSLGGPHQEVETTLHTYTLTLGSRQPDLLLFYTSRSHVMLKTTDSELMF